MINWIGFCNFFNWKGFLRIKFPFIRRANKIIYLGFLKLILLGKSRKIWKTSLQAAMLAWVMQTLVRIQCLENLRVPLQGSSARFVHGGWVRDLVTTLLQSLALPLASFFVVKVMTSVMASSYSVTGNVYKAHEWIHHHMADHWLPVILASCRRVATCNPN